MQYEASVAYRLDSLEREELELKPRFGVVEGGGLDAQARRGVSSAFLAKVKFVVVAIIAIVAVCAVRLSLTAATAAELSDASVLQSQIADAKYEQSNLLIVKSSLSSSVRIDRIATQNYGMVYPESSDVVSVDALQSVDSQQAAHN